jgi:myo-inositol-1(or 4)-monophosphatase
MLYTAARGEGAWLNGVALKTSSQDVLSGAEILATKPMVAPEHWPQGVPDFTRSHRPSLAYRLSLVGQGRFDAMLTLRPTWEWDVAAGALIVEEASGTCTDKTGGLLRFNNPVPQLNGMLASGPRLHGALLRALGA